MKRMIKASLVAALALSSVQASSLNAKLSALEAELADLKKQVKKQNKKINKVNAQSSGDNIKWGVDFRTAYDNINYDMLNGTSVGNSSLYSMRLWLNMAYAPDQHNVFKGQLSMHKAFGAKFDSPLNRPFDAFDWTSNEALTDNSLKVRQAYWLYLGDKAFGADVPWTFSIGRRPSTNGFLANLSQDDAAASPLGHVINVEFDGLSSKLDLSNVTGIPGMSFKVCLGYGSTNAVPLIGSATPNADIEENNLNDIKLGGFIFEPYNDGQYIVKTTWYRAFDLPDLNDPTARALNPDGTHNFNYGAMSQVGNMDGAAISVLVDGVTDEGYFADAKLFGSFAWSKTNPDAGQSMLTNPQFNPNLVGESQTGTSYWFGAYLPVGEGAEYGTFGAEFNHGSQYWRPFTYGEDTMIGSKIAARGNAWELNYTYQINDALSFQARYVSIDYDFTGSNGFFGGTTGTSLAIDGPEVQALKQYSAQYNQLVDAVGSNDPAILASALVGGGQAPDLATASQMVEGMVGADAFYNSIVDKAQNFRVYLRYRF